ncbi:hypothetical protein JXC34_00090 [Candidatus Woesearchaeota archaeon]|nr:hypothetical protein [Candidatus Woesearchaeota archaeon]
MTLSEDMAASNIVLLITTKTKYNGSLNAALPEIRKSAKKIGYITINRPYGSVVASIQKLGIDPNKFLFVDAITATVQSPSQVPNCIFVSSPTALTDLGLAFSSLFENNCDLVFFDTISTLIVYQDIGTVTKFVHNLVTKARVSNKKAVFMALKEDSENLIKDLNMFVDKIVEF